VNLWTVFLLVLCIPAVSVLADEVTVPDQLPAEATEPQEPTQPEEAVEPGNVSDTPSSEPVSAPMPSGQPEPSAKRPVKHLVQPGDTLWSISSAYLIDPFYWPKVWDANRSIKNPDRIYPGMSIMLPPPEVLQAKIDVPTQPMPVEPEPVEEEAGEEPVAKAPEGSLPSPTEPPPVTMEPTMEMPLDTTLLASVGFVLSGDVGRSGILVGAKDNRVLVGEGDIVYLRDGNKLNPKEGGQLLVYRSIRKVYHPKTGAYMGRLVVVLGTLRILETGPKITTAKIIKSYNYILSGDRVAPYEAIRLPSFEKKQTGESIQVKGYVVDVKEEKVAIGQFDVVYIDRGMKDGIGRGSSFKVIRDGDRTPYFSAGEGTLLPPRIIGELEVISANDHTATAKVRKSSEMINRGDRIEALTAPTMTP
jgi:LysM repeat protein